MNTSTRFIRSSVLLGESAPPSIGFGFQCKRSECRIQQEAGDKRGTQAGPSRRDEMQLLETTFWSAGGSRHAIADQLGFSKSKANALIAGLVEQGVLVEAACAFLGRPPRREAAAASPRSACCSASTSAPPAWTWPCCRPTSACWRSTSEDGRCAPGPGVVLARVRTLMRELLAQMRPQRAQVIGIGIGVPGPVDFDSGQLVNPPLMPDWDSFSIRDYLREDFAAPVFVDNDVNLMALGELWRLQRTLAELPGDQGGHRHRLRHRLPRRGVPRRRRLGRRRRPHLRGPGRAALPLRQPRLRRGDGSRPGHHAHGHRGRRGRRERGPGRHACGGGRIDAATSARPAAPAMPRPTPSCSAPAA